jgi:cytochrome c peroxidase
MRNLKTYAVLLGGTVLVACAAAGVRSERWSEAETAELESLWIGSLEALPADPTNRYADDPRAVALGHHLFFDTRLSSSGTISCATCHRADREFQDDVPLGRGVGTTDRRTMPVAGTAYAPFLFWDGRKDSQWAQALGPLESPVEHGGSRGQYAHVVAQHYRAEYEALFGALPDLGGVPASAGPVADSAAATAWQALTETQRDAVSAIFVNIGKAIAAYERRINYGESRFDRYVAELLRTGRAPMGVLTPDEVAGARLFIGRAGCTQCHNGPLFTNNEFHNTGVAAVAALPRDQGRWTGARAVLGDEFNCRSRWSDADPAECRELEYLTVDAHELERAFKVPSLRNVADRPPYMHAGQIATLGEAVQHYNRAPAAPGGHTELKPLKLNARELHQLEAYLRTLSGGTDAPAVLLAAPRPSPPTDGGN